MRPYQQSLNNKVNTCISPEAAANAYSRILSTIADNSITALRTTNNLVFSSLDAIGSAALLLNILSLVAANAVCTAG